MKPEIKKLLILNLPYLISLYLFALDFPLTVFGVRGQAFELFPGDKLAGDAVEGKLIALVSVVIVRECLCGHVPALLSRK